MATFTYKARRLDGSSVTGTLPAENERAALVALDRMGLFPLDVRPEEAGGRSETLGESGAPSLGSTPLLWTRKINPQTASRFARELADLCQAGVPILKALDAVCHPPSEGDTVVWGAKESKDDARARTLLQDVRRDVAQGAALAQALQRRPDLFGETSISIIKAGEAGGFLDAALRRVAVFSEREQALNRRIKGALTYPALLSMLSAGAVAFLLVWVVPRFATIYSDLGGDLPGATQFLMDVGDLLRGYWWLLLGGLGGGTVVFGRWAQTPEGRLTIDRVLLRLPLIRSVVAQASMARFTRTLGTLLGSGVNILQALEIAKDAAGNREFTERLATTLAPIREGAGLAQPLRKTQLFPPQVLEMIEVGQDTGTLVNVLDQVGERADEEVDHALKVFVTVFEPALIVAVASVVFFVVLAALLPVFSLNSLVQ